MPKSYSEDFRWRVALSMWTFSETRVTKQNFVSPSTVERLVYKYRRTYEVVSLQDKYGLDIKLSSHF